MYKIFSTSADTWENQISDILNARSSIYFEQYILRDFEEGEIGKKFIDALIKKAEEGLEVRLILDFQGSLDLFKDSELNDKLKKAGLLITYYKTLPASKAFSPIRLMLRDHRKFMVVDHTITWIGGVVVGEDFKDWNDFMIRFDDLEIADYSSREFRRQILRMEGGKIILAPLDRINDKTILLGNSPGIGNRFCYEKITHQILLSKKSVVIVTPYFSPPVRLRRAIERRLGEGLEIKLMIPKHSDNTLADWVREVFLKRMIKKGLIVEYGPKMNHAKIVLVDKSWCTFGSTNIDILSLLTNHELNMITEDQNLVKDIYAQVDEWSKSHTVVKFNELNFHTLTRRQKIIGRLCRYFV